MNNTTTGNTPTIWINPVLNPVYRLVGCLAACASLLENWRRQQQLSAQLGHIDTHTLLDAGISEAQRFMGVNHPFE